MLPEHWTGIVRNKYNVTDGLVFIKAVQGSPMDLPVVIIA